MSLKRKGSKVFNISVNGEGTPFIWAHGLMGSISLDDDTGYFHAPCMTEKMKLIRYDARGGMDCLLELTTPGIIYGQAWRGI